MPSSEAPYASAEARGAVAGPVGAVAGAAFAGRPGKSGSGLAPLRTPVTECTTSHGRSLRAQLVQIRAPSPSCSSSLSMPSVPPGRRTWPPLCRPPPSALSNWKPYAPRRPSPNGTRPPVSSGVNGSSGRSAQTAVFPLYGFLARVQLTRKEPPT